MNIKKIKQFFTPIEEQKGLTAILVLYSAYLSFFWIYSVEIIKQITISIEKGDLDSVYFKTALFVGFILSMSIVKWVGRPIYPTFYGNSKKYIQKKYIRDFILFENNSYEKIGTGRLIALIERGIDTWQDLITNFFYFGLQLIFSFIFSLLYIYSIIGVYTLIIIAIILLLFWFTKLVNTKSILERSKMIDYGNLYTKDLVKVIMSKFEVLQNDRIDKETSKLEHLIDRRTYFF